MQPNVTSEAMKDPKVRQAFAMATNRDAYVTANGGKQVMTPTLLRSATRPASATARTSTRSARPLRVTRPRRRRSCRTPARRSRSTSRWSTARPPPATRRFAALKQTWDQAGFNVTLDGVASSGYYRTRSRTSSFKNRRTRSAASWGADWPSGSTVLPPLFDGRINLTPTELQPGLRLVQQRRRQQGDRRGLPDPRHRRPREGLGRHRPADQQGRRRSSRWSARSSPSSTAPASRVPR